MKEILKDNFIPTRLFNTHCEKASPIAEEELSLEGTSLALTALVDCRFTAAMSGERNR